MGVQRNRTKLTEVQRTVLEANPNVEHLSSCDIFFTKEFKDAFWREFSEQGIAPKEILKQHGFDIEQIGISRFGGFLRNQKKEHGWVSQRKPKEEKAATGKNGRGDAALRKQVKQLEHQVELLTQQMDYIKKTIELGRKEK